MRMPTTTRTTRTARAGPNTRSASFESWALDMRQTVRIWAMRPWRSSGAVSSFAARAMLRGYGRRRRGQCGRRLGAVTGADVVGDHRPPGIATRVPLPAVAPQEDVDQAAEACIGLPHAAHDGGRM